MDCVLHPPPAPRTCQRVWGVGTPQRPDPAHRRSNLGSGCAPHRAPAAPNQLGSYRSAPHWRLAHPTLNTCSMSYVGKEAQRAACVCMWRGDGRTGVRRLDSGLPSEVPVS